MKAQVSAFMLERYKLGELDSQDTAAVNEALSADDGLRLRLEKLDESDRELRLRYGQFGMGELRIRQAHIVRRRTLVRYAGIAALIIAGVMLPVLYLAFFRNNSASGGRQMAQNALDPQSGIAVAAADRSKGTATADFELSVYLKGNQAFPLADQSTLEEGSTVQLAYSIPAGEKRYGVIFSIDGRSVVTMHYPYGRGQSSLLVSGRQTFLNEAYTLDDAPGYEVFVMVVSAQPLDAEDVIRTARFLAGNTAVQAIVENSKAAFDGCGVETAAVLKKQ